MSWSWRAERQYWGSEWPRLWRSGKWVLLSLVVLSFFSGITAIGQLINGIVFAIPLVILGRRILVWNRLPEVVHSRQQERAAKQLVQMWPALAAELKLNVRDHLGRTIYAGVGMPAWRGSSCFVPVMLPPGMAREDLVLAVPRIASAFNAQRATVLGDSIAALTVRLDYADALAESFSFALGGSWDGRSIAMGLDENGQLWRLPTAPHLLVAGASGSGKASMLWAYVLGLVRPIHDGVVEVWGIDLKGGMELTMGRALFTRFADDAELAVVMLEEAVVELQARARQLAGKTRQHAASAESPHVVVLIDELAALTAYQKDRGLLQRGNAAIATLASQGRAVGYTLVGCLQDPRKEAIPARGLFLQTIALRLRDRTETAMVLGEGAIESGALSHTIALETPGVAYVVPEDGSAPVRVRAPFISDDDLAAAALTYFAPRQRPIVIPAEPEPKPRRPRTRSTRSSVAGADDTKEES